jgi:hypothetical protein
MPIDIVQLLTFAGTTGIITALLTTGIGAISSLLKDRRSAQHLALQLAAHLEQFAQDSADAAADVEAYVNSRGKIGFQTRDIPMLAPLPQDTEAWRALKVDLRNRAISIPLAVTHWHSRMRFDAALDREPDDIYPNEVSLEGNLQLAIGALQLAEDLRRAYGWWRDPRPGVYLNRRWMPKALAELKDVQKTRDEERGRQAKRMQEAHARFAAQQAAAAEFIGPPLPPLIRALRAAAFPRDSTG